MFGFQKLEVYQEGKVLVRKVYALLANFPKEEKYALGDQLRRAAVSVPSNIAEGMSRSSQKEQLHFIEITYGSLMETFCQLEIAKDLNYISADELMEIETLVTSISIKLSKMRKIRMNAPLAR